MSKNDVKNDVKNKKGCQKWKRVSKVKMKLNLIKLNTKIFNIELIPYLTYRTFGNKKLLTFESNGRETLPNLMSNVFNVVKGILLIYFISPQIWYEKFCQVYSRTFSTLSNVFCLFIFTSLKFDMKNVVEFIVKCCQRF